MSLESLIRNELVQDTSSVWVLKEHSDFGYSDGVDSEAYLENVFKSATDLSNGSAELEDYIRDWPSEYHLTAKRAHLFAGFDFDPTLKVLEVGCGCGAISRYLGETFVEVLSIEGSIKRARLARLRTKELQNVSIVCAPFQEIDFSEKFDIIFCVGVYEYSASFVDDQDPYDSVLRYFRKLLNPNGVVVIAIENQFGLKYFHSSREDHTGRMFDGLEGYHGPRHEVRTFGRKELENNLLRHFSEVKFYYPYPDYKIPNSVLSEEFLSDRRSGELVSQIKSRDYHGKTEKLWNDSLMVLELARNEVLPFFSNSFLVFASESRDLMPQFDQLAVLVSNQRKSIFRALTRIYGDLNDGIMVSKQPMSGLDSIVEGKLTLNASKSKWQEKFSLQTQLYISCIADKVFSEDLFKPCQPWVGFLKRHSERENGREVLDGRFIDCIFSNVYLESETLSFVDDEWSWGAPVPLNVLIIRAIYYFVCEFDDLGMPEFITRARSTKALIIKIANSFAVDLTERDFSEFVDIESEMQSLAMGTNKKRNAFALYWILRDKPTFRSFEKIKAKGEAAYRRIGRLVKRPLK